MLSQTNDRLRQLDALKAQLGERDKQLKALKHELPDELQTEWKTFSGQIDEQIATIARVEGKPIWSQSQQLLEQLGGLSGGEFRAPSAAQQAFLTELQQRFTTSMESLNGFFNTDVAEFNALLSEHNVPALLTELQSN